ncbi:MAG: N(4)-(beta-N-acetylglucosaminyl)-L-asparaginase [Acidobacteria bacterium]|nr:N(4)-(beta-N-acetylglucosaminyl)-L-asparaginase [Acidobacteriota bacterium]
MGNAISRRDFVKTAGVLAAGTGTAFGDGPSPGGEGPIVLAPRSVAPVVVSSANGNKYRNGGSRTCVEEAFERIVRGEDVLDALVAGVNIVELDPEDDSVGYGGLPNADGVVQLDASCVHGPKKRAGAVAALEGLRTPSRVAKAVMELTDHHLVVGKGAQDFARQLGFEVEDDLNTERSRRMWLEWKRRIDPQHWVDPSRRSEAGRAAARAMIAEGLLDPQHVFGTINCNGVSPKGEVCGVTTTSGLAFKIPGRVGDSPILGAGLYVDGEVGAAGSTGRGEANLFSLSSFFVVECLRRGMSAKDAGIEALRRVVSRTEKRLLDERGYPRFGLRFYVVDRKGGFAGVSMYAKSVPSWMDAFDPPAKVVSFAVCTQNGPETRPCDVLLDVDPPAEA